MPGTVLLGLGALFMRSVIHWWTAASMHIGSGSGRFITVGMQVNPLVLGLASVDHREPEDCTEAQEKQFLHVILLCPE